MTNVEDGRIRLGALIAAVGGVGSLCGALVLYTLGFHETLNAWSERVGAVVTQVLAAPAMLAQARLLVIGHFLLGGSSLLLATGLGLIGGLRALRTIERGRPAMPAVGTATVSELPG